jgi:hypothetical protein
MKKQRPSLAVEVARRMGKEAWLAVRARPGGGTHKDRRAATRAVERRRAIAEAS